MSDGSNYLDPNRPDAVRLSVPLSELNPKLNAEIGASNAALVSFGFPGSVGDCRRIRCFPVDAPEHPEHRRQIATQAEEHKQNSAQRNNLHPIHGNVGPDE
jgi:hypothetical protein